MSAPVTSPHPRLHTRRVDREYRIEGVVDTPAEAEHAALIRDDFQGWTRLAHHVAGEARGEAGVVVTTLPLLERPEAANPTAFFVEPVAGTDAREVGRASVQVTLDPITREPMSLSVEDVGARQDGQRLRAVISFDERGEVFYAYVRAAGANFEGHEQRVLAKTADATTYLRDTVEWGGAHSLP